MNKNYFTTKYFKAEQQFDINNVLVFQEIFTNLTLGSSLKKQRGLILDLILDFKGQVSQDNDFETKSEFSRGKDKLMIWKF